MAGRQRYCEPLEIPELVTPLGDDAECVLEEGDYNHETSNGG